MDVVSLEDGAIQAMNHDLEPASTIDVDLTAAQASPSDYDALILPGGTVNADRLRMDGGVRSLRAGDLPGGQAGGRHLPRPVDADRRRVVEGRTLTSYPSLRTDLTNAGAKWVDEEVVTDEGLVSSRNPGDLDAFCAKIVEEFAEGAARCTRGAPHERRVSTTLNPRTERTRTFRVRSGHVGGRRPAPRAPSTTAGSGPSSAPTAT